MYERLRSFFESLRYGLMVVYFDDVDTTDLMLRLPGMYDKKITKT